MMGKKNTWKTSHSHWKTSRRHPWDGLWKNHKIIVGNWLFEANFWWYFYKKDSSEWINYFSVMIAKEDLLQQIDGVQKTKNKKWNYYTKLVLYSAND